LGLSLPKPQACNGSFFFFSYCGLS